MEGAARMLVSKRANIIYHINYTEEKESALITQG